MQSSTKRVLSIAFSAVLLIGTLVVYGNLIRPAMKTVSDQRSIVSSKERAFSEQTSAVLNVQEIINEFQNTGGFSEKVELAIPRGSAVTDALNQINAISISSNADIIEFGVKMEPFSQSEQDFVIRQLGTLSINMAVRGSYEDIKAFVESLETNARISNIKEMKFGPIAGSASTGATGGLYSLSLTVEVYFQE